MSWKIWNAYRCRRGKLLEATAFLHGEMYGDVLEVYHALLESLTPERSLEITEFKRDKKYLENPEAIRYLKHLAAFTVIKELKKVSLDYFFGDVECGLHCYVYGGFVYFIPYGFSAIRSRIDSKKLPSFLEDFYYQNSTDAPKDVPSREWKKREHIWDNILGYKTTHEQTALIHFQHIVYEHDATRHADLQAAYDKKFPVE